MNKQIKNIWFQLVYVARNPKDVAVSWYYQHKYFRTLNFVGDFPTFWKFYKNDLGKLNKDKKFAANCSSYKNRINFEKSTFSCLESILGTSKRSLERPKPSKRALFIL